jgi:hypothetical protein
MNVFVRFLNYWAGVDNALLRRCPRHERSKYANSGMLVLVTGVFAFSGAAYAVFTVYEAIEPALFYGAIWAMMIVNLDRLLLTTFPKKESKRRQFGHALPRLILAGFVGFTIAHPLTVRLFQPEILDHIGNEATARRKAAETRRNDESKTATELTLTRKAALPEFSAAAERKTERDRISTELGQWADRAAQTELDIKAEIDGTAPSRKPKCGPICRGKQDILSQQRGEMVKLRSLQASATKALSDGEQDLSLATRAIDSDSQKESNRVDHEYQLEINSIASMQSKSFFARSSALSAMAEANSDIRWKCRFLAVMLVVVEIIVVFIKLLTPADSADQLAAEITAEFEQRIPAVAREMAGVGQPVYAEPPEPEPVYQTDPAITPPTGDDVRRRNILVILTTIFVMVFMAKSGNTLQEIVGTGALFLAATPLLAFFRRRRKENVK